MPTELHLILVDKYDHFGYVGSNPYQTNGLKFMSPTAPEQAAWHANSDRNMFGFTKVPLIGLVVLAAMITLSALGPMLPAVLIAAPLIAVIIPAVFSGVTMLTLAIAGLYTYVNRNQHVDDRYNLEFERATVNYDLYLDEDKDYVNKLLSLSAPEQTAVFLEKPTVNPGHYPSPLATSKRESDRGARQDAGLTTTSEALSL